MGDQKDVKPLPSSFDLTDLLAQFMDRHMVLPMLDFLLERKVYPDNQVAAARLDLISKTKMVDFYFDEYSKFHNTKTLTSEQEKLKKEVYSQLQEWKVPCGPLLDIIGKQDPQQRRPGASDVLFKDAAVTEEHVRALYKYAKLNFDCGRYPQSATYLHYVRVLSKDEELKFNALWGKLAAEILMNSDLALEDIATLQDAIDARSGNDHISALQQRAWLLHWALPVFFNQAENGLNLFIDFVLQDSRLLNALQTTCPHLLRYLTCAVIITKRKKNGLKDLVKVITQEKSVFSDPLTAFVQCLYVEFDFEAAQAKLQECQVMLENDYFLNELADELLDSARHLVFETYARTHHCIDIDVLARRLDIKIDQKDNKDAKLPVASIPSSSSSSSSAPSSSSVSIEQKLLELIRGARVDVKIDSKKNQIVVDPRHPSIYQQVIDKTEAETLIQRTEILKGEIEKFANSEIGRF